MTVAEWRGKEREKRRVEDKQKETEGPCLLKKTQEETERHQRLFRIESSLLTSTWSLGRSLQGDILAAVSYFARYDEKAHGGVGICDGSREGTNRTNVY